MVIRRERPVAHVRRRRESGVASRLRAHRPPQSWIWMFNSFRARAFALAALLFIGLWATPAAAAAAETSPDLQGIGALAAPTSLTSPAPAFAPKTNVPGVLQQRPLHDLVISFVDYGNQGAEEMCLAKAVYFEARSESLEGQLAVAQVVLNRAASGVYPPSICGVVTQHAQFSFIRAGRFPTPNTGCDAWHKALAVAEIARKHLATSVASNVLWYHANYVSP